MSWNVNIVNEWEMLFARTGGYRILLTFCIMLSRLDQSVFHILKLKHMETGSGTLAGTESSLTEVGLCLFYIPTTSSDASSLNTEGGTVLLRIHTYCGGQYAGTSSRLQSLISTPLKAPFSLYLS